MKRILALFLSLLCLLLPLVGCTPSENPGEETTTSSTPETVIVTDPVEVNVPYKYSITDGKVKLLLYTGNEENVVVPETIGEYPVAEIGEMTFANNTSLKSVDIPGSIEETGKLAFYHCDNLTSVTLHEGTTKISYSSFCECSSLKNVSFPSTVKTIGFAAFKGCTSIESINLEGIETLDDAAFCASGLKTVTIPTSVTTAGAEVFMECVNLTTVNWVTTATLRESTFAYCYALTSVTLAEGVSRIYDDCFRRCTALENIEFPSTCNRFYDHAMYGCVSLKTITIKCAALDRVYDMAFHFLPSLTDVFYAGSEEQFKKVSIDGNMNEGLLKNIRYGA